ncbi:hypothetical protein ACWDZ4_20580 [Streptomyces sp. NPDC003016]
MTNTRKTSTPATEPDTATAEAPVTVIGLPLRTGQEPEKVTFAHHLRIDGRDLRPGDSAHVSPDYARQLRNSGYLARGRD